MNSIFHRRSIRRYTSESVSQEDIDQIIKAGMAAPTACNDKQWEFYIVRNPEIKELLAESSKYAGCAQLAPVVIVPCYHVNTGMAPEYTDINMAIVCENMWLEADSLNLGAVMLGIAPEKERMAAVAKILDLPADIQPFALMPVGHPASQPREMNKFDASRIHYVD